MRRPRTIDPGIRVSPDERAIYAALAPLRTTLEAHVAQRHAQLRGKEPDPHAVTAEVEVLWTLVLEAYRRGVSSLHQGLRRAEGIDHEMLSQSLDFALTKITKK